MGKIILEITHSSKGPKEYKSFDTELLRIGRGYFNDVILSDPYISAGHITIVPNEDGFWVEDLNSQNGIYSLKQKKVLKKVLLQSGDEFMIGKTAIKILTPEHSVVLEKRLIQKSKFIKYMNNPLMKSLTVLGLLVVYALETHMTSDKNLSAGKLVSSGVGILMLTLAWAGLFAFIGGIVKQKARFFLQLAVSALFMILLLPAANISSYLGYASSQGIVELGIYAVAVCILFDFFLVRNLALATNIPTRRLVIVATIITVFLLSTGILLIYAFKDEFNAQANYYSALKPPFAKIVPSQTLDEYLSEAETVFHFKRPRP